MSEKKSKILENQEKWLEFIRTTMSAVEGEEFYIFKFNLYHPMYTIFGDNFYIGSVIVIGNEAFAKDLNRVDLFSPRKMNESSYKFQAFPSWLNINEGGEKTVVLKYAYQTDRSGERYYSFKSITNLNKQYPYLVSSVKALNNCSSDEMQVENVISALSRIVESYRQNNSSQEIEFHSDSVPQK